MRLAVDPAVFRAAITNSRCEEPLSKLAGILGTTDGQVIVAD